MKAFVSWMTKEHNRSHQIAFIPLTPILHAHGINQESIKNQSIITSLTPHSTEPWPRHNPHLYFDTPSHLSFHVTVPLLFTHTSHCILQSFSWRRPSNLQLLRYPVHKPAQVPYSDTQYTSVIDMFLKIRRDLGMASWNSVGTSNSNSILWHLVSVEFTLHSLILYICWVWVQGI